MRYDDLSDRGRHFDAARLIEQVLKRKKWPRSTPERKSEQALSQAKRGLDTKIPGTATRPLDISPATPQAYGPEPTMGRPGHEIDTEPVLDVRPTARESALRADLSV